MQKILILSISVALISSNALAIDCPPGTPEGHQCYDCSTGGSTCMADYDTASKKMVISGKGAMIGYPSCPWSDVKSQIKTLEIKEGITNVGGHIFDGSSSLTEVKLPSSIRTIGEHAFSYSPNLTSINIPEGVQTISMRVFLGTGITNLALPSTLKSMSFDNFRYTLDTIILMSPNTTLSSDFPNASNIYCLDTSNCAEYLKGTRVDLSKIKTFSLKGNEYWVDGKKYESVENLQLGKNTPIRIYTVEEATWLTQQNKGKNTFTLKYR